jgi:hypothetical protein
MNIFILDEDIVECAKAHIDAHSGKMQLEAAQMLCTNHWVDKYLGYVPRKLTSEEWAVLKEAKTNEVRDFPYLPTMYNHPCTIWARESQQNYEWLFSYAMALNEEHLYRGGANHKSFNEVINKLPDMDNLPDLGLTPFAQAMPDELKSDNAVESYRMFYMKDKAAMGKGAKWKVRGKPHWWDEDIADYEHRISGQK